MFLACADLCVSCNLSPHAPSFYLPSTHQPSPSIFTQSPPAPSFYLSTHSPTLTVAPTVLCPCAGQLVDVVSSQAVSVLVELDLVAT
ncbi:hypothetical protein RRG08_066578 [Elysia crispata]|uniref:Uncharacterized protein n=1 Tax=Elysia crispata TaxID=231223 RepID=A0AAE0Y0X8_9GAST|nr:hypothetical protein RRG08_066578 [Elysia crispata]